MYIHVYIYVTTYLSIYLSIFRYNHLKDTIFKVEGEIKRLHDPLQLNLPTPNPAISKD